MWWWQSQELAGAFNFGGSVPVDHLTCCAAALRVPAASKPAAAPADMTFSNSRRPHGVPGMISSRSFARNLTTPIVHRSVQMCLFRYELPELLIMIIVMNIFIFFTFRASEDGGIRSYRG